MSLQPVFEIGLWNAWLFMSVFIVQMMVMFLAGKHTWERSHVPDDARPDKRARNIAILSNLSWLLAMVYSVFLPLRLGTAWFTIGLAGFIVGSVILARATFDFMTTPADRVIKKGAYRISRHPMYLATSFICLGSGIAAASWFFILLSIILGLCFHQEALIEERYCSERYGEAYRHYQNSVPRWIGVPRNAEEDRPGGDSTTGRI